MYRYLLAFIIVFGSFSVATSQTIAIGKADDMRILNSKDFESEKFDLEAFKEEIKKSIKVKSEDLDHNASTKMCLKEESRREQNSCFSRYLSSQLNKKFEDKTVLLKGKYKISIRCKIDSEGDIVFILAEGPSPESELSAIMALKDVKGIIPANYNGQNVDALVAFPIIGLKR